MNLTYLRMEIRRLIRNRRVLIFSMLMPAILIVVIGGTTSGELDGVTAQAYLMVSLGLFGSMSAAIGYVARPDSVQQISGLLYMLLAAFGGLWVPVEVMPHVMRSIAEFTPAYWVGQVARSPLFHHSRLNMQAALVVLGWAAGLGLIALRRFQADTARA